MDLESFIHKAGELGYEAVELMGKRPHLSVVDTDEQLTESIRQAAQAANVRIATIAGYTDFTMGCNTETPAVEMQVAYVRRMAQIAQEIGAKIIRVFTGYTTELEVGHRDWSRCVEAVRECAQVAGDQGVILGLQNHHDVAVSVDGYVEFLDDVNHPNCRAMFDPWSPAIQGEDLNKCARRLAPRMVQTTLADYARLPRYSYLPGLINYKRIDDMIRAVPLGSGFVDIEGFCAGLREGGFDGYVAYEMCSPLRGGGQLENLDKAARIALDKIRRLTA